MIPTGFVLVGWFKITGPNVTNFQEISRAYAQIHDFSSAQGRDFKFQDSTNPVPKFHPSLTDF